MTSTSTPSNSFRPHPQGSVLPLHPVSGPCSWEAADFSDPSSYTTVLSQKDVSELVSAIDAAELRLGKNENAGRIERSVASRDDFPLPSLGPKLLSLAEEAKNGRGFVLIKGFPVEKLTRRQAVIGYRGLGLYWGNARPNSKNGALVGHIKDIGADPSLPTTRLYATRAAQPWHNDNADLVSLLCLSRAESGGESGWCSSIAVHNEVLKSNPEAAKAAAARDSWFYDRRGEGPAGKKGFFEMPVFNYFNGFLSVNFSSNYFRDSQRFEEVPRLSPEQLEAIALIERHAASPRFALKYELEQGDIQLLSNHTVLHFRGAFENSAEQQRHLLRLWLSPEEDRPLPKVRFFLQLFVCFFSFRFFLTFFPLLYLDFLKKQIRSTRSSTAAPSSLAREEASGSTGRCSRRKTFTSTSRRSEEMVFFFSGFVFF